jgi:integrase
MPVRNDPRTGGWYFRITVKPPGGKKQRLFGTPGIPGPYQDLAPNEKGAIAAEQRAIAQAFADAAKAALPAPPEKEEVPTFGDWFNGRFWREWVVAQKNKPTEVRSKEIIYRLYLEPRFKDTPLDKIDVSAIAQLRADLVEEELSEKRINNILAVLSKPLHYAVECNVISKVPRMGLYKVERPEIEAWDFDEYPRILTAADATGDDWYIGTCLAGEAGLRVGEVKALRRRRDIDMFARTITVREQTCNGVTTTPKGRTRRTIPMTHTLYQALLRLPPDEDGDEDGYVVCNHDGSQKTDAEASWAMERICRKAGLPVQYWHRMRHSYGTHAALFGVNPWRLQGWMGHKRIEETMLYVHVADHHRREIPQDILVAAAGESDPDARIIKLMGARGSHVAAKPGIVVEFPVNLAS